MFVMITPFYIVYLSFYDFFAIRPFLFRYNFNQVCFHRVDFPIHHF